MRFNRATLLLLLAGAALVAGAYLAGRQAQRLEPWLLLGVALGAGAAGLLGGRKRAPEHRENLLSLLVERSSDVIYMCGVDGRCTFVNRAGAALFEREPAELIGQRYEAFMPPEVAERLYGTIHRVIACGQPLLSDETLVGPDGRTRHYMDDNFPYYAPDGSLAGVAGICRDVTERVQAEQQLAENNARLRALDQMKDEIISAVSHDLRTPLTAIVGYLELLDDDPAGRLSASQREYVAAIRLGAERLQRLIEDLLDFALLEAGELRLSKCPFDLVATARRIISFLEPLATERSIALSLHASAPELVLAGDASRIEQVMTNLVGNAIKFTPAGGRVEVGVAPAEGAARVEVRDTGPGIPSEVLPRLFERFYRASESRARAGAGLGLAIAKQLVEIHDGAIGAVSAPEGGSVFWFTLPREAPAGVS